MAKPYERVTYQGKTMNRRTMAMVQQAEDYLGYDLTIYQGSYHPGVSASGGTHDGGGALDFAPWDWQKKVRVFRQVGFAAWHRPTLAGQWDEHIHAIAIGDKEMSDAARKQVQDYYAHLDGLARHQPDRSWRPNPIPVFRFPLPTVDLSNVRAQAEHPTEKLPGVKRVQAALNSKSGANLLVDGLYGPKTKAAMKRWEIQHGGDGDGLPGEMTKRLGLSLFKVKD